MTSLSASLLELRAAYGRAHQKLLGEGSAAEARVLELMEALAEGLPPEALSLSATQAVLLHFRISLPEGPEIKRWSRVLGVHLYHSQVNVPDPLYSLLYDLEPAREEVS